MKIKRLSVIRTAALILSFALLLGLVLLMAGSRDLAAQAPSPKQEGIAYVSWWHGQYESDASDQSLAKLEDTGAEWISLLVTWYQENITATEILSDTDRTPTDADLMHAISTAHSLGLNVMLKPHLDLSNDPGHWRGEIGEAFTSTVEWDAWFASYQNFINYYAQMAQDTSVEQFCVGTELEGTIAEEARWREIISGTGGVTSIFTGPLVYAANWTYTNTVMFWDALDYIGIDAYYTVAMTTTATVSDMKLGWTEPVSFLQGLSEEWDKPIIFTEIGYRSIDGAGMAPWDYGANQPLDMQEQADLYQAFFEVVFPQPWLHGVFLWSWDTNPMQGGKCSRDYTPVDKPAEDVLRFFYGGDPRSEFEGLMPRPDDLGAMYIYTDQLAAGWWNGSWNATVELTATDPVYTGTNAISVTVTNWGGLSLGDGEVDTTPYHWVEFYLNKANPTDDIMNFWWQPDGTELPKIDDCRYTISETNGWAQVRIPLESMQADTTLVQQFAMQPYVNGGESTFGVDQVRLLGVIPVELSDGYAQQTSPGWAITYDHILQNYLWTTDTIEIEAVSSRDWPLTLIVGGVSSPTVQLGPGMTTTVQVQLTVPPTETIGMTDTTEVVATLLTQTQYFDTLTDVTEVVEVPFTVYLPVILRDH